MNLPLYAVIPSGSRLKELTNLVKTLVADGVHVVVVNTGYEVEDLSGLGLGTPEHPTVVIEDKEAPKNISRWWNHGIKWASNHNAQEGGGEYVVAVLNDDILVPPGFVQELAGAILYHDVVASFPDVFGMGRDQVFLKPSHWRMSGFAFALRGSAELRADEDLVWWYGDNDLEWQAFQAGGVVTVGGLKIQHLYPNSTTVGELAEQAGRDRQTFSRKWGQNAW